MAERCCCARFVGRWGPLFEENRGPPMVMRGATYETDRTTGMCHRGTLEPHLGRPFLVFRCVHSQLTLPACAS